LVPLSMKPPAFLSYARRADSAFALSLAEELKQAGANVWLDQLEIRLGQHWDHEIEQTLESCSVMLVILSPAAVNSSNVMDEVSFALDKRKTVIPIIQSDCSIPFRLRRLQYVDFRADYALGLKKLLGELTDEGHVAPVSQGTETNVEVRKPTNPLSVCEAWRGDRWVQESIMEALEMRSRKVVERRRCLACHDEGLVPHKEGKNGSPAHFEHDPWNEKCPLRDQAWEEERLARKALQEDGLSKKEAWSAVEKLRGKAKAKGTTFGKLSKRARGAGIDRREFLDRFAKDPDALMAEIESREP
jgi:TIR domain